MVAFKGHFDGKVVVPDEPVSMPQGRQLVFSYDERVKAPQDPITLDELARSEFAGSWRDRVDISDSVDFVNDLRSKMEKREL